MVTFPRITSGEQHTGSFTMEIWNANKNLTAWKEKLNLAITPNLLACQTSSAKISPIVNMDTHRQTWAVVLLILKALNLSKIGKEHFSVRRVHFLFISELFTKLSRPVI